MTRALAVIAGFLTAVVVLSSTASAQSKEEGKRLWKEAYKLEEHAKSVHDLEAAVNKYNQALSIFEKIGYTEGIGKISGNLGNVYKDWGQYNKAMEYYEKSLEIAKKGGDIRGEGATLNNLGLVYSAKAQYSKAVEHYEKSLEIRKKVGDVRGEGATLNNLGLVYRARGQYAKAVEYYEKSLELKRKIGDLWGEVSSLNNLGVVYERWGQYGKAVENYEKSLEISREIGDIRGEGNTLNHLGNVSRAWGQYAKALEHYQKSLEIKKKVGDVNGEGLLMNNLGNVYATQGQYSEALAHFREGLEVFKKIGVPTSLAVCNIGNLYLDCGEIQKAEPFIKETNYASSLGRLSLLKADYPAAKKHYERLLKSAEQNKNTDNLFTAYTGLGKTYEALENYKRAEEYYEKGMNLCEEIRSGILPSERKDFFEVKINGFYRSEPAKGLTRVRMKLNQAVQSIDSSEVTRARAFSDHISMRSANGLSRTPQDILEREDVLVTKVAVLKKELAKTDKAKQTDLYENLQKELQSAESDLHAFLEKLWDKYRDYAAIKYPRPVTLKESSLRPEEHIVMFDVSTEGVGVKLIKGKKIAQTFYTDWKSEDLEKDVKKFRQSFEEVKLKEFDPSLGNTLYKRLLAAVLLEVPEKTPLVIIPDGILATLPFETLVTGGKPIWKKVDKDWPDEAKDYPEGLTFLGDEHPISYYQSITALTLARTAGAMNKPQERILVIADPVFDMLDMRAQSATQMKLAEQEKKRNIAIMQTIEDSSEGTFKLSRLPQTSELADNLERMYGSTCVSLTGLKANRADFLSKVAPDLEHYGCIVFATHGVMSTHVPGLMEPFLALTMAPSGTDGFLKMSDVLSLKMNADIVALTACQTGLGKELSGEGVMSMGRAFQYAGSRSVLMTLWSVSESGSVLLVEKFFKHLREKKTKLDALQAARDDVRKVGYKHPFFWAPFILVGEVN